MFLQKFINLGICWQNQAGEKWSPLAALSKLGKFPGVPGSYSIHGFSFALTVFMVLLFNKIDVIGNEKNWKPVLESRKLLYAVFR